MNARRRFRPWLAAALLAAGCIAQKPPPPQATPKPRPTLPAFTGRCIFINTIRDWKAVDPFHVLVQTRARGWQWEVVLERRCNNILFAEQMAWLGELNQICDYRRDSIAVQGDRCMIAAIHPWAPNPEPIAPPAKPAAAPRPGPTPTP